MSATTIRRIAVLVCAGGIAGMIVSSILNHNGTAITFGLITATAVLCSMVATAVAADTARTAAGRRASSAGPVDEEQAMAVETLVQQLVAAGAQEGTVRDLVRQSVRLGRGSPTAEADNLGQPTQPFN
jgi:uncharacterized membrane protein YebE (DUF533 family)